VIRRPFRPGPIAAAVLIVLSLAACGSGDRRAAWPLPNADLDGTRAAVGSTIDTHNVSSLRARWRLRFAAHPRYATGNRLAYVPQPERLACLLPSTAALGNRVLQLWMRLLRWRALFIGTLPDPQALRPRELLHS